MQSVKKDVNIRILSIYQISNIKAGFTFNEVTFEKWVYEEELETLNMEHVTFGIAFNID